MSNKTINVIRHVAFEDLGSFTGFFESHGFSIRYHDAGVDDLSDPVLLDTELLVVLGGPISVNDGGMFGFIGHEVELLKARISAHRPTLGICLGAQLIAIAAGASVFPGKTKEIGWYDLTVTEAGEKTAVTHLGADRCRMLHWHGETYTLPESALRLASSEACENQAFSLGDKVLALQFHPEVTKSGLERWYIGHIAELSQAGIEINSLRQEAERYAQALESQGQRFIQDWLRTVGLI